MDRHTHTCRTGYEKSDNCCVLSQTIIFSHPNQFLNSKQWLNLSITDAITTTTTPSRFQMWMENLEN